MSYNIAIDGPAGAGKSTIARIAAKKLGYIYIDTGAMYRTLAYHILKSGIDCGDEAAVGTACLDITVKIAYQNGEQQLFVNGENVTPLIRTEEVGVAASIISAYPAVREKLLDLQRSLAAAEDVIMDGRDIGTCILPGADVKIYLTAGSRIRALRRYQQLLEKEQEADLDEIERDIIERDRRDMNREIAPLKQAEDAVYLDTSAMTIDEVVDKILDIVRKKTQEA